MISIPLEVILMRAGMCSWIVCVSVVCTGIALAAPKVDARDKLKLAQLAKDLDERGEPEKALAVVEQGLAVAPKDLALLGLKGRLLLGLRDYSGALAAYQAYLAAGPVGANRRDAQKVVESLLAVKSTFLDITLASGAAAIYLDSRTQGVFCTAAPTCSQPILPGDYKVIVERPGFERWTGPISVPGGTTTRLAIALVEKPSLVSVRVAQPGAMVALDDAVYDTPRTVAAGKHRVTVSLKGHVPQQLEAVAREGKPVELDVVLAPRTPVRSEPPTAQLLLDGKPITVEDGGIAVPPGAHTLIGRAAGFQDRSVDIPAERPADFAVVVELARIEARPELFSGRRKASLVAAGVGVAAATGGILLRRGAQEAQAAARAACASGTCNATYAENDRLAQSRRFDAGIAFAVSGFAVFTAAVLWITESDAQVAVAPRVGTGAGTGLDVAVRF